MKKAIFIVLVVGLTIAEVRGQENEKSNMTIGFNIGMDYNNNAYRMTEDNEGFTYFGMNPSMSFGADFGYNVTRRFRPRFEVEYFYLQYGMNWNYGENSDFDKTTTTVHYMGLNLHLDYALVLTDRIQVYLSPGVITDLAMNRSFKTYLNDDDDTNAEYNVLSEYYPEATMGVSLSLPVAIKINEKIDATLEPEYTYFPNKFVSSNPDIYTRMSFKVGLQYTF